MALLLVAANRAASQHVIGTVRDSAAGQPVGAAVVWLTDSLGRMLARSIGMPSGRYELPRGTAAARLHVIHIGFRPVDIALSKNLDDSVINVRMGGIPAILDLVQTSSTRVCPGDAENGGALALWEQVRAALLASVVGRQVTRPRLQLLSFLRDYEPIQNRIIHQKSESKQVVADRSYSAARPAWQLASEGYMEEETNGERTFFAPDEEVLLDRSFAETHCLRVVAGTDKHQGDIGLGFDPVRSAKRDTMVDVSGVLWVDRSRWALREIQFDYTGLERAAKKSGGEILFETMPNGTPMIQRWSIFSTAISIEQQSTADHLPHRLPPRPDRSDVYTLGYREQGGVVAEIVWPDSSRWHSDLPRIVGIVLDPKGEPFPGARVWMFNRPDTVVTNDDGIFKLPYVFPGVYTVFASDSALASEGVSRVVPTAVSLVGMALSGDRRIQLRMYPRADVFRLMCPAKTYAPGTGVVTGHVVDESGAPIRSPRIDIESKQFIVAGDTMTRSVTAAAEADENGKFSVCGAALNQPLTIRATKDGNSAGVMIKRWGDDFVPVRIVVKPPIAPPHLPPE
ncbi:MAG: carboxypeptidase-like regulatory domain-containing protein [Gemmatimonadaceae bacterium]